MIFSKDLTYRAIYRHSWLNFFLNPQLSRSQMIPGNIDITRLWESRPVIIGKHVRFTLQRKPGKFKRTCQTFQWKLSQMPLRERWIFRSWKQKLLRCSRIFGRPLFNDTAWFTKHYPTNLRTVYMLCLFPQRQKQKYLLPVIQVKFNFGLHISERLSWVYYGPVQTVFRYPVGAWKLPGFQS